MSTLPTGEGQSAAEALDWLVQRARIEDVLVAYCQGVDRREWDQVLQCYHPDAHDTHGSFSGRPSELVAKMRADHEHVSFCMHALSNVLIRFSDDDPNLAQAESYCVSRKVVDSADHDPYLRGGGLSGPVRRTVACRYVDTFQRRSGVGWRILKRTVVHEWMRSDPDELFIPFAPSIEMSRRDRTDLLFAPIDAADSAVR